MAMEDLKAQLTFLKEIEIKEVIEDAKEQAATIIKQAQTEAEQIKKREAKIATDKAEALEAQELETIKIEGKRREQNARFRLIDLVFTGALDRITEAAEKGESSYKNILGRLTVEAAKDIQRDEFEIIAHKRDVALLKQHLKNVEKDISRLKGHPVTLTVSEEPLRSAGGIILRSKDGQQIFNNTLEARLAKVKQDSLIEVSKILFEGANE